MKSAIFNRGSRGLHFAHNCNVRSSKSSKPNENDRSNQSHKASCVVRFLYPIYSKSISSKPQNYTSFCQNAVITSWN